MGLLVSVIAPTYNESKNIPVLVRRIDRAMHKNRMNYEIIVVDDNSPDNTYGIAKNLAKKYPVRAFLRTKERGLSSAMYYGYKKARGNIVGWIDADLQHKPELIPDLVKAIRDEGYLMAIGSRLTKGGGVEGWSAYRRLVSLVGRILALPLTRVKDTQSGFFFIKPEVIEGVKLRTIGYKLGLEVMVKGKHEKKIKEVPYVFLHRSVGKSKMNVKTYVDYVKHVITLYAYKVRQLFV
jgi:dolichol-phosphate mannosyltransferase